MIIGCQEPSKCQCVCDVNCPWTFVSPQLEAQTVDQRENGSSCKQRSLLPSVMRGYHVYETIRGNNKSLYIWPIVCGLFTESNNKRKKMKRGVRGSFFLPQTPPAINFSHALSLSSSFSRTLSVSFKPFILLFGIFLLWSLIYLLEWSVSILQLGMHCAFQFHHV